MNLSRFLCGVSEEISYIITHKSLERSKKRLITDGMFLGHIVSMTDESPEEFAESMKHKETAASYRGNNIEPHSPTTIIKVHETENSLEIEARSY